jgi:hypothetical protein
MGPAIYVSHLPPSITITRQVRFSPHEHIVVVGHSLFFRELFRELSHPRYTSSSSSSSRCEEFAHYYYPAAYDGSTTPQLLRART